MSEVQPSKLYSAALHLLAARGPGLLADWQAFEGWLGRTDSVTAPYHGGGARILENIRCEAHLVGPGGLDDATEFANFMEQAATLYASAKSDDERLAAFINACGGALAKGRDIALADIDQPLHRYGFEDLIEQIAGCIAQTLLNAVADEELAYSDVVEELAKIWDDERDKVPDRVRVASRAHAFATFGVSLVSSTNAKLIAESLALPAAANPTWPCPRRLVRLKYLSNQVGFYRYPTIADADTYPHFQPAGEAVRPRNVGWTLPFNGASPQPELLHDTIPVRVLVSPIQWVGEFWL